MQVLEYYDTAERSNDCSITIVSLKLTQSKTIPGFGYVKLGAKPDLLLTLIGRKKLVSSRIHEVIRLRHKKRFITKNLCSLH